METEIKVQIILALILAFELLGLFMIIIRTVANLEYAFNRVEEIITKEVQLALTIKVKAKDSKEKIAHAEMNKGKKNELLLNIPFMERLSKEKRKENE